jgi:hypothetical protein
MIAKIFGMTATAAAAVGIGLLAAAPAQADPVPPPAPVGGASDGSIVYNEAPGDYEDSGSGVGDIYLIPIL